MASIIAASAKAIFEIDEMSYTEIGDVVQIKFVTTGLRPELTTLKTKVWGVLGMPPKKLNVVEVSEVERGPLGIYKRYIVTCEVPKRGFSKANLLRLRGRY